MQKNQERNGQKTSVKRNLSDIHTNKRNVKAVAHVRVIGNRKRKKERENQSKPTN
jgi:hypothetical protein